MPDAEPGHAYPEACEPGLLLGSDEVSVAVQPQGAIAAGPQYTDDGAAPGGVGPAGGFGDPFGRGCWVEPAKGFELFVAVVEEFDPRVRPLRSQRRAVVDVVFIENLGAVRLHVVGPAHGATRSGRADGCERTRRFQPVTGGAVPRPGPDRPRSS